jgi:hypothetical protein
MRWGILLVVPLLAAIAAMPAFAAAMPGETEAAAPAAPEEAGAVASSAAQSPGPCAGIGCSGHGTCAVLDGRPTCACDEGFRADPTNGLGCLPLEAAPPAAPSLPPSPTAANPELAQVESILGGIDLADHYTAYLANPKGKTSFYDYALQRYQQKKSIALAVTVFGVLAVAGAGGFFGMIGESGTIMLAAAIPMAVAGVLMILPGAILYSKNKKLLERLRLFAAPGAVAVAF